MFTKLQKYDKIDVNYFLSRKLYVRRNGMSDANNRMLKLQSQLKADMQKGKTEVIKRMTPEQAEFVSEVLHHEVHPYLYKVYTKRIENVSGTNWTLREIHNAYKKGRKVICKRLRNKDLETLNRAEVKFQPVKYRVVFNAK